MHIQLEESQVIWWVLGGAASAIGMILSGMWAMLSRVRDGVVKQIDEANARIERHMETEEGRWNLIYQEFHEIRTLFVTREVLELRLAALEANIDLIRKVIDTRRSQRRSGPDDEKSERIS